MRFSSPQSFVHSGAFNAASYFILIPRIIRSPNLRPLQTHIMRFNSLQPRPFRAHSMRLHFTPFPRIIRSLNLRPLQTHIMRFSSPQSFVHSGRIQCRLLFHPHPPHHPFSQSFVHSRRIQCAPIPPPKKLLKQLLKIPTTISYHDI